MGRFISAGTPLIACCVCVLMRPAVAIEPPDGNSTVVTLLRVRNPGMLMLAPLPAGIVISVE